MSATCRPDMSASCRVAWFSADIQMLPTLWLESWVSHMSASIHTYAHTTYAGHHISSTLAFLDDKNRRHVFADMPPTLPTCRRRRHVGGFGGASRHDTTPTFPTKTTRRGWEQSQVSCPLLGLKNGTQKVPSAIHCQKTKSQPFTRKNHSEWCLVIFFAKAWKSRSPIIEVLMMIKNRAILRPVVGTFF